MHVIKNLLYITYLDHSFVFKLCTCQKLTQSHLGSNLRGLTKWQPNRALCRIQLLPVTHVLVDTWMLTVKPVHKLSNVPDDLKWATKYKLTCDTIYTHFQGINNNIYGFGRPFFGSFIFLPVHPYFCPSIFGFTRPNDGWTGLYTKLCNPGMVENTHLE